MKDKSSSISPERAKELIRADPNSKDGKIKQDLVGLYNYMEYVCTAYELGVVDRERIEETYSYSFIRAYDNLKNFFHLLELEQHGQRHICAIERVVTEWKSGKAPIRKSPLTG